MTPLQPNTACALHKSVSVRKTEDAGTVLYHADAGREKVVNASGARVLGMLDGQVTCEGAAERMTEVFENLPSSQALEDVMEFLSGLVDLGFVVPCEPGCAPTANPFPGAELHDAPLDWDVSVTGRCNLHCAYCFYDQAMKTRPDMPAEAWLSFFQELGDLGVRNLTLSGGEVFIRPEIWELIDGLIAQRMRYSLLTNGTLVTEKTLQALAQGKRRNRLDSIQVSIDGSCAEVHDKSRGKGSFERAIRAVRLLKEAGFPVISRVTVNRHNVDDLENTARLLLNEIGLASIGTNDAMPMGAGCFNQESITLLPEQEIQAMKSLMVLESRYNGRITATAGPQARWKSYHEMEDARETGRMSPRWKMGYLTSCGCMYNKLAVHHDGVISPCNMLAGLELGRATRDPVPEIWKHSPTLQALRDRRSIPMNEVPGCEDCTWAPYCNGGCPGLAHDMTGDFNRANPQDCYRNFLKRTGLRSIRDAGDPFGA